MRPTPGRGPKLIGLLAAPLLALIAIGCDQRPCDAGALEAALGAASPGDVVEIGECRITGSFDVPAGVTLRGVDAVHSTIASAGGGRALSIDATGSTTTRIERVRVESDACAAIVAVGDGASGDTTVELLELTVAVARGVGIAAEDLGTLRLSDLNVAGPFLDGSIPIRNPLPPYRCEDAETATHGIVVTNVGATSTNRVWAQGFAAFGMLFVETELAMQGGGVANNVGVGLEVWSGQATIDGASLCTARQGMLAVEAWNGLFAGGARVTSSAVEVCDGEAFGLMHDDSVGIHEDLVATGNGFAGVWSQNSASLVLDGPMTRLADNGFAGVAALRTDAVRVEDATLEGTEIRTALVGDVGSVQAGDGVHVTGALDIDLHRLALTDNERVGLLFDLGGAAPATLAVDAITVTGSGEALGAIAQNSVVPDDWDDGVARVGDVAANDAAFEGALDIAGAVGPSCLPDPSGLALAGLGDLVGP